MVKDLQNYYSENVIREMTNILDGCIIFIAKCLICILIVIVLVLSRFLISLCISYKV